MIVLVLLVYSVMAIESYGLLRKGWRKDFTVNAILLVLGLSTAIALQAGVNLPSPATSLRQLVELVIGSKS
ncbi:hypothetical protein [Gorillibacterium timonense]|uniref:hypothetical protein n=1 Tax=Gorillibacterium timonense TaxID=1689269 RepID=UPI00071D2A20|nr:hypothetical protein [Gorillibacterium timonense]